VLCSIESGIVMTSSDYFFTSFIMMVVSSKLNLISMSVTLSRPRGGLKKNGKNVKEHRHTLKNLMLMVISQKLMLKR